MGEAKRRMELGLGAQSMKPSMRPLRPGEQIPVDLKNAVQKVCECGCKFFTPVVEVHTISALVSPTGQELTAQKPVLICKDCGELMK